MVNLQEVLTKSFKIYLIQLGYGKSSTNMLPACVKDFLTYTNTTEGNQIKQEQIKEYYDYLQNRKHKRKNTALSESYINHHVYSLKVFFKWLEQTRQLKTNPISNIKFKQPKANTREPLSKEEINQLFEATENSKEIAILHLCYSCGLRRTEAQNLNTTDIHFNKNILYIREGKGAKRRAIPITEKVKKELEIYYNKERTKISEAAFMLSRSNQRMSGSSYNTTLKTIIKRTEINKEITLHHLRHSIATHLLENGLSIEFVRDFLGHSHLETTQLYAKVKANQLKKLQQ